MASPRSLAGLNKSISYTVGYLWRWFVLGLIPTGLAYLLTRLPEIAGGVFLHNFVGLIVLLPGALAVNLFAIRRWPHRRWSGKSKPAWVAAGTSLLLTWAGYLILSLGGFWAQFNLGWVCAMTAAFVLGSNLGLLAGWVVSGSTAGIPGRGLPSTIPRPGSSEAE
jgi:hypothetical protein